MAFSAVLRTLLVAGLLLLAAFGGYLFFNPISQDKSVSVLIFSVVFINMALVYILIRVLLVEHSAAFFQLLEKLPGVHFSRPIPEHLRTSKIAKPLQIEQPQPIAKKASHDAELPAQADEPFTLGVAVFEPPEPIAPVVSAKHHDRQKLATDAPHSRTQAMYGAAASSPLEHALSKTQQASEASKKQRQFSRFLSICQQLKQMNEEVAVWTEGELATLANTMLSEKSREKEMVAILLPQRVARLTLNKTFEYEFHAQVFKSILLATGVNLPVSFVYSSKVELTGQCVVNFEYDGKPVSWRFIETDNRLSPRFVENVLTWIAVRANGKFYDISDNDIIHSYVFISNAIAKQLANSRARKAA